MLQMTAIGYVGQQATVTEKTDNSVINFSVAITKKYKDQKGVQHERTIWVSCSYWVKNTTVAQYLLPGTLVCIQGEPSNYFYHDKNNQPQVVLQCNCDTVKLLKMPDKKTDAQPQPQQNAQPQPASSVSEPMDDLPF